MTSIMKNNENILKNAGDTYKKVSDIISKLQKEFDSISGVDISKVIKGDLKEIENLASEALKCFDIIGGGIDKVLGSSLNVSNVTNQIREGYEKVKNVVIDVKDEVFKISEIDYSKVIEGDLRVIESLGDGVINIFSTMGGLLDDFTNSSSNISGVIGDIREEYEKVKNVVSEVTGEISKMKEIDFSGILKGDLTSIKTLGDGFLNCVDSIGTAISGMVGSSADIKGVTNIIRSGIGGALDIASTVQEQIENMSEIDFSKAAKGGAAGIAEVASGVLSGVSAIGNSVFGAVMGVIDDINKKQIEAAEKTRDAELAIIKETEDAKKAAIEKELEDKMAEYENQLELLEAHEEEKAAAKEEWDEYLKEYDEKMKEDMSEEERERLEVEKETEREKYDEKMAKYEEDALNKATIEEQMRLAEEAARNSTLLAEQEAANKKAEAEKNFQNKKAQIQKKAAIAQRAIDIFNATIAMFQGMAQAVAAGMSFGPAAFAMIPILVALAGSMGGVQIAAISSQPLPTPPSFSKGGQVGAPNDSYYNFIPKADNPKDKTLAWLSEGEYVLTRDESLMYQRMVGNVNNYSDSRAVKNINVYTTVNAVTNANPQKIAKANAEAVVLAISRGY